MEDKTPDRTFDSPELHKENWQRMLLTAATLVLFNNWVYLYVKSAAMQIHIINALLVALAIGFQWYLIGPRMYVFENEKVKLATERRKAQLFGTTFRENLRYLSTFKVFGGTTVLPKILLLLTVAFLLIFYKDFTEVDAATWVLALLVATAVFPDWLWAPLFLSLALMIAGGHQAFGARSFSTFLVVCLAGVECLFFAWYTGNKLESIRFKTARSQANQNKSQIALLAITFVVIAGAIFLLLPKKIEPLKLPDGFNAPQKTTVYPFDTRVPGGLTPKQNGPVVIGSNRQQRQRPSQQQGPRPGQQQQGQQTTQQQEEQQFGPQQQVRGQQTVTINVSTGSGQQGSGKPKGQGSGKPGQQGNLAGQNVKIQFSDNPNGDPLQGNQSNNPSPAKPNGDTPPKTGKIGKIEVVTDKKNTGTKQGKSGAPGTSQNGSKGENSENGTPSQKGPQSNTTDQSAQTPQGVAGEKTGHPKQKKAEKQTVAGKSESTKTEQTRAKAKENRAQIKNLVIALLALLLVALLVLLFKGSGKNKKKSAKEKEEKKSPSKAELAQAARQFQSELGKLLHAHAGPNDQRALVIALYNLLLEHYDHCGIPKPHHYTPDDFDRYEHIYRGSGKKALSFITSTFNRAFYGLRVPGQNELNNYCQCVGELGAMLAKLAPHSG